MVRPLYKVVLVGAGHVGRKSIIDRILGIDVRVLHPEPDYLYSGSKAWPLPGEADEWGESEIILQVVTRIAGTPPRSGPRWHVFWDQAHCIAAVYDVGSSASLEELRKWFEHISTLEFYANVPRLLIGNKSDLPAGLREVEAATAQAFAKEWRCEDSLECSANTGENVDFVLQRIMQAILEHHKEKSLAQTLRAVWESEEG